MNYEYLKIKLIIFCFHKIHSFLIIAEIYEKPAINLNHFTNEDYLAQFRVKYYPIDGIEIILNTDFLGGKNNYSANLMIMTMSILR